ncbi:MAG: phosphate regulon sensor histidine kinase PhoR [Thiothrix nivea]|nr:MAG: phosphate regulon sensor histidine kinase PhoR [Thiothrix nivea]
MNEYWRIETRRLILMIIGGLILGYFSGYWLVSQWLASLVLIGWMLYKLHGLQSWIEEGQPDEKMPDSDGAWEQMTYTVHRRRQQYEAHEYKQQELLSRFNNIMAALPDANILLNPDHIIQWSNGAAKALLGIDNERDTGQRIDNLIRVRKITKLVTGGMNPDKEVRFRSPRDETISLSAKILPVQPGLYMLSVRNISQRVHLNNMRRAFIANASHELRTPLTVLSGYLELFEDDPALPEHLKPAIRQAREQGIRMQRIISDMLKLSQLENSEGKASVDKPVNIPQLIRSTATNLQKTIAADSHQLSLQVDETIKISGIEKDLTSVVTNLLENSVKYTPAGSQIRVDWQRNDAGQACLAVTDDGPGIAPQHLEHLTERFYRVDKGRSRDKGGTGLGLAIVKHAVLNHGGTLDISSVPGKTVFAARFPEERII